MKNKKIFVTTQIVSLLVSLFAFSFIVSAIDPAAPVLRGVPGGVSESPYSKRQIEAWSKIDIEKLVDTSNSDSEYYIETGDLNLAEMAGVGAASLIGTTYLAAWAGAPLAGSALGAGYGLTYGNICFGPALTAFAAAFMGFAIAKLIFSTFLSARNLDKIGVWGAIGIAGISAITAIVVVAAFGGPIGWIAAGVAAIVTAIVYFIVSDKYSRDVTTYTVGLWQPEFGGKHCLECNSLPYGCSEYQCHTYGADCAIINPDTEDEKCVWKHEGDTSPPVLTMLNNLPSEDYSYEKIGIGYKIKYKGGCLPPHKGLTFGINTSKESQCKYDIEDKQHFSDFVFKTNQPLAPFKNEHTIILPNSAIPSEYELGLAEDDLEISASSSGDLIYRYYFKCKSTNGIENKPSLPVEFCINMEPDITATVIGSIYPPSGTLVANGTTEINISFDIDEDADCKWDFEDVSYKDMENPIECMDIIYSHQCKTTLNGIKQNGDTNYFIRCKDKPDCDESATPENGREPCKRIENQESRPYTVSPTDPLVIDKITIDGLQNGSVLEASTFPAQKELRVYTSDGASTIGLAKCKYRSKGKQTYRSFYNGGSFDFKNIINHKLSLGNGTVDLEIFCYDEADNFAKENFSFTIDLDDQPPIITRVLYEGNSVKLMTSEPAKCVYSVVNCNYDFINGTAISTSLQQTHAFTSTGIPVAYIKCEDEHGNKPSDCSIKLKAHGI